MRSLMADRSKTPVPTAPRRRLAARAGAGPGAPWVWAFSGVLLGLLISSVLFAPARWLSGWVRQASAGQVLLQDARGTLWSGSARLTLAGGAGSQDAATLPTRLQWQLRPVLAGGAGLALQLGADCCLRQPWQWRLLTHWGGAQLLISDAVSQWPAQLLAGLGTPWNTLAMQGQLVLRTQALGLRWASGRLQLAGLAELDAQAMSSRLSTLKPMGSYRFALTGGAAPTLRLSTLSGALQLAGQGQWVGGRLRFDGVASSTPEAQAALSNLLNIIGRRDGARSLIKVG